MTQWLQQQSTQFKFPTFTSLSHISSIYLSIYLSIYIYLLIEADGEDTVGTFTHNAIVQLNLKKAISDKHLHAPINVQVTLK